MEKKNVKDNKSIALFETEICYHSQGDQATAEESQFSLGGLRAKRVLAGGKADFCKAMVRVRAVTRIPFIFKKSKIKCCNFVSIVVIFN